MPTVEEIIEDIVDIVDDPDFESNTDLVLLVNRAIRAVASSPHILLPGLETSGTVTTVVDAAFVDLPAEYHKGLYGCDSTLEPNSIIDVAASLGVMRSRYGPLNNRGYVSTVCVRGGQLCYQGIPAIVDTLTLYFYGHPPSYAEGDTPAIIPEQFHDTLLVEYCCWKAFAKIEDGIEGAKVNTAYYKNEYELHLEELGRFIGRQGAQSKRRVPVVRGNF